MALPIFFNIQIEPQNYRVSIERRSNLFSFAKQQGFRTALYSAQSSRAFSNVGVEFVDTAVYRDTDEIAFSRHGDEYALELLEKTPRADRNFFVVHTFATHYPYEKTYRRRKQFDVWKGGNFKIDTYDNAMLYIDDLYGRVLDFAAGIEGRVYVLFTSDHGQMMGEDGLWGHSFLNKGVAEIPFILWTKDVSPDELYGIDEVENITHIDAAKFVARTLGFDVHSPNTPPDVFYINGTDIDGSRGFLKYKKSGGAVIELPGGP